jgi:hypothetical protein
MKALDFDLSKEINFDFAQGITSFRESRLVILDANALGLLRQNLLESLGMEAARAFFLRLGYQNGYADFLQMKLRYPFENELELLSAGPVVHTWEGIVKAIPSEITYDRKTGHFYFAGIWRNSYEAEQHLSYNENSPEPVCWSLVGYASGWCSGFFGKKLIAMETACVGQGDAECRFLIQPAEAWGEQAIPHIKAYERF